MLERSIPAHAGEPGLMTTRATGGRVYPRPRGGTHRMGRFGGGRQGLSPPTRGNRDPDETFTRLLGSIPAHAGEPDLRDRWASLCGVYPRPRGGTLLTSRFNGAAGGLSPPTRGNLFYPMVVAHANRSIPAHAGEPDTESLVPRVPTVYPRPRGGTPDATALHRLFRGLSPPTRGNLPAPGASKVNVGSIPAHAGEPGAASVNVDVAAVYPRPRGGTIDPPMRLDCPGGLSPPTRGNRNDALS